MHIKLKRPRYIARWTKIKGTANHEIVKDQSNWHKHTYSIDYFFHEKLYYKTHDSAAFLIFWFLINKKVYTLESRWNSFQIRDVSREAADNTRRKPWQTGGPGEIYRNRETLDGTGKLNRSAQQKRFLKKKNIKDLENTNRKNNGAQKQKLKLKYYFTSCLPHYFIIQKLIFSSFLLLPWK